LSGCFCSNTAGRNGRAFALGSGRINLAQGAVITVQGTGAALSPALGGWIAQWIGFAPTFLLLGGMGLIATGLWIALRGMVRQY